MNTTRVLALVLPLAATTACAHISSQQELKAARQAYGTAANGPARAYAPDSLQIARNSLVRAEEAHQSDDTQQRSFALLALSRAEAADARGRTALAVQERDGAQTRLAQLETQKAARAAAECQGQQRQGVTAMQPTSLDALSDRKESAHGITRYMIWSGLEFPTDESTLSASSRDRLDKVADALKQEPPSTVVQVEGFTDTTGTAAINNPLSEQRARAVAQYLRSRGVTQTVRTRGLGSSQPIGNNATPTGRQENRRAEVIIVVH